MAKKAKKTKAKKTNKGLMSALVKHVNKSSLNQTAKDLGYGSHNTVKRWIAISHIPERVQPAVKKFLGVK